MANNKVYIGQSNKETERWRQHKYFSRQENPIQYIHRAMKKYGIDYFVYEVIASCKTQEDANETEMILINQYNSCNKYYGYNIAPGGNLLKYKWNKGLPKEQQPMYGKKQSKYQKQRTSEVHKGKPKPHSIEWSKKISSSLKGHFISDETKIKISKALSGEKHPKSLLTNDEAKQIKKEYKNGSLQKSLAKKYGVSQAVISFIISGKTYKNS